MTSIDSPQPPTHVSPPPPKRFLRSPDDRVLGGVAGGLGRAFGVDAIIFRIVLAALVFAGGVGLLVYGAALLFVPVDDGTGHPVPREGAGRMTAAAAGGVLLVLAAFAVVASGDGWASGWLFSAALVLGVGYLALRLRKQRAGTGSPLSRLLLLAAVGLAVLFGATLLFWGSAWATAAGGGAAVAAVVLVLGVVLVVASFRGDRRARWLALPALLLAFPAAVVASADVSLDGGVGQRTYAPTGADRVPVGYRVGAGELVVDLRGLDWSGGRRLPLKVGVGVGHALVLVPEEVCVGTRGKVSAGYSDLLGREASGLDVALDSARTPATGVPALALDAHVGMGALEVLHRRSDSPINDNPRDPGRRSSAVTRDAADRACTGAGA